MSNYNPIGVFDSGVGGLSTLQEITKLIPNENFVYIADNINMPYGKKSLEQLREFSYNIAKNLITNFNAKIIVIACNTSTTASLDFLRQNFSNTPFVGVVPVVKPSCEISKTKKIAILSTPATANSNYQKELINKFSNNTQVFNIACPGLAELVEQGQIDTPEIINNLNYFLKTALENNIDVIGLSCTHYVFLKETLKKIIPENITILDSNTAVAKQTLKILNSLPENLKAPENNISYKKIFATKDQKSFQELANKLLKI